MFTDRFTHIKAKLYESLLSEDLPYSHRRRKVSNIGGGQGLEYWGAKGGGKFPAGT